MLRRIAALALALMFSIMLLPSTAYAIKPPYERLEAVDYSRLPINGVLEREVELVIGEHTFDGFLSLGKTLTKEEEDAIIRQVMLDMQITSGMLIRAKYIIQKVERDSGFDMDFVQQLGLKFALSATGLDNIRDIYDVLTGKEDIPSTAVNMILGEAVSAMAERSFGGVVSVIITGLFSCTEPAARKVADLMNESDEAKEALEKTVMLNTFYDECNRRIAAAVLEKGKGSWVIEICSELTTNATLFGIPVEQRWYVSGDLFREKPTSDNHDPANYSGTYKGDLKIEITHNLKNFDQQFVEKVARQFKMMDSMVNYGFPTTERHTFDSKLTKKLTNTTPVIVNLDRRNMGSKGMSEFISLKDFEDESVFKLDHLVRQGHPNAMWDQDGHLDMIVQSEQGPIRVESNFYFESQFGGGLQVGNRYPAVQIDNVDIFGDVTVHYPVIPYMPLIDTKTTLNMPFLADYQIFDALREGEAELIIRRGKGGAA